MTLCRALVSTLLAAPIALAASPASPCTTVQLGEGAKTPTLVGKSYDWANGLGMVVHNKRGVAKRSAPARPGDLPATWVSKYASLTFNQYGHEMPNGGMNEAGLVVEIMWLSGSEHEPPDGRPALNELQWVQYQLDRYATVAEVLEHRREYRVSPLYAEVHYMVCDKSGACATFEHLDGRLVVHHEMPAKALTNSTYADSTAHMARFKGLGGDAPPPRGQASLARFVRAAQASRADLGADPVAQAFATLDDVKQGDYTKWQIVYEPEAQRAHFRTLDERAIKTIEVGKLPKSCGEPVLAMDMARAAGGDVTDGLRPLKPEDNRALVRASAAKLGDGLPPGAAEGIVALPRSFSCTLR